MTRNVQTQSPHRDGPRTAPALRSPRRIAVEVLGRYERRAGPLRTVLAEKLRDGAGPFKHPAAIRALVTGVIKYRPTLDWALTRVLRDRSLTALPLAIRNVLRLGAFELLMADPHPPGYAVVHEAVEIAKGVSHQGLAALVNGTLRQLSRRADVLPWPDPESQPVNALALRYAHPEWLVARWLARFGREETEALCQANNADAPFTVRVNLLRGSRETVLAELTEAGYAVTPTRWSPSGITFARPPELETLAAFQQGRVTVQDEASQLVSHLVVVRPGAFVIDACAAPGGKTLHLAEFLRRTGRLLAVDLVEERFEQLCDQAHRLGVTAIETLTADARTLGERFPQMADGVLLDAPCSGLGILRRRPELRWQKRRTDITRHFPHLQAELLDGVAGAVKPGGTLVYAVCSGEPEETDERVLTFLQGHPAFSLVHASFSLPAPAVPLTDRVGVFRTWPHQHSMDGFFAAKFVRER